MSDTSPDDMMDIDSPPTKETAADDNPIKTVSSSRALSGLVDRSVESTGRADKATFFFEASWSRSL